MKTVVENAAAYFVDRHVDKDYASKAAFVEADGLQRQLTYSELATETGKMVELYQHHDVQREDRAAMLVLDQLEFPIIFWGSLKAGVVPIALNTLLSTELYDTILQDCRARVLFVSEELLPVVQSVMKNFTELKKVFVIGTNTAGHLSFVDELSICQPGSLLNSSADECAFWLYSSGSTGQPKGVRHVHGSLEFTADTYGRQVLGIAQDDVVYSVAKFFFAYGLGNSMTFPQSVGATTVIMSGRPTPPGVIKIINQYQPTVFCGVPTLYAATIAHIQSGQGVIEANLRRCISAGEALPEDIGRNWESLVNCEILDGVGSTEMLHIFLSNRPGEVVYGTSGIAVPGYQGRLVNEHGDEVEVGDVGELLVNGNSAASDYWNQRNKSRTTFEGEWTRTGDKYEKSADGRLIYCGRTDDMFKVSGIWVSPFEVEQALVSHPDVLEAAVVPCRDDQKLEKPRAFVVLKHDKNPAEAEEFNNILKEHVKERIGKWKYPRWINIVPDLPKTATGKIQRFKLRD